MRLGPVVIGVLGISTLSKGHFDPFFLFQLFVSLWMSVGSHDFLNSAFVKPLAIEALENLPTLPPLDLDPTTKGPQSRRAQVQNQNDPEVRRSSAISPSILDPTACGLATQLFKDCLSRTENDVLLCRDTVGTFTSCIKTNGMPVLVGKKFIGHFYHSDDLSLFACMAACQQDERCYAISYDSKRQLRPKFSCFFMGPTFNQEDDRDWKSWINPIKLLPN